MLTTILRGFTAKFFSVVMVICLVAANLGTSAYARDAGQASQLDAQTQEAASLVKSANAILRIADPAIPAPTVVLAPTSGILSTLDLSSAGEGTLYRARVTLKQPHDLARLSEWGIKVLDKSGNIAYVQATEDDLERLARLEFEPTEINSLDYMVAVYNAMNPEEVTSLEALSSSSEFLMSLSTVDVDLDGLSDTEEAWWCTNPNDNNSDSPEPPNDPEDTANYNPNLPDNLSDGKEVDALLRGIKSYGPPFSLWPKFMPQNPNGNCPDGDFDAIPDYAEEFMVGTSNLRESSDLDKFDDGQELFGVTYCPGASGPCGYGILPRAEDAAFVSANLPAWVKAPGNSPFVAAFPEPRVEVVPSSIVMTQKTVITNTNGTTTGTEKTYGTSSTKGSSTSLANTETWNNWQEVSETQYLYQSMSVTPEFISASSLSDILKNLKIKSASLVSGSLEPVLQAAATACGSLGLVSGCISGFNNNNLKIDKLFGGELKLAGISLDEIKNNVVNFTNPFNNFLSGAFSNIKFLSGNSINVSLGQGTGKVDQNAGGSGACISSQTTGALNSPVYVQPYIQMNYPVPQSSFTSSKGTSRGGSVTTTTTQYEEQTISESSTNQFSESWSTATAVDSTHAADLRFTYNIVNNGTEYAREVSSLTFNIYIGSNPNPAYTYVAVGATGQIASIQNLFPGDSLTYTSNPIALTLDEMRAIDEGAPIRIVMEDISFGQDQVFYLDALNGSVMLAMEDGYDDLDETVDTYLIPVWDPSDTVQDVAKRFFPAIEDTDGNLLAVFTPEPASSVPASCVQDANIAPASNTTVFCKHALTGTSWWNFYLSDGLDYSGAFNQTLAAPNTTVLVRILSDRDLDGYNDRNEIRLGTNPDDAASHPAPNLLAGYTKSCAGNDCTLRMVFQNLGNYDAYGVEAVLYSPDGKTNVTNNTIGGSGRVPAGQKIVVGPSDTFQYTITDGSAVEPVIIVSYNDPQGNHRFILPTGTYPTGALVTDLNNDISGLNGKMLPNPGVEISSTSASQANFVINSPHPTTITNGKLYVEYIDDQGTVLHEDNYSQDFLSGPNVIGVPVDLNTYPPATTILLAFFTDSQGNIIDSSARPLASFGPDPLPEASLTAQPWEVGALGLVSVPDPWDFGSVQPGTTLYATLNLANTGLGDLIYSLTGLGNGVTLSEGSPAGSIGSTQTRTFKLSIDTAGKAAGPFAQTLTLRTSDPTHGSIAIHITGTIQTPGQASAYPVNDFQPWNQYLYVAGPHSQNDVVTFSATLPDTVSRMYPISMYTPDGQMLKGVGEYGVDFSGQTAPFGVFGTGTDGNLTVTSGQTVYTDNTRSALVSTANSGQAYLALSSVSGFAVGQEVLVMQMQGTGAGNYEFGTVISIASNTIAVNKNLTNTYTVGGNSKAQVIRVMQYNNLTIQNTGLLTAHSWDGSSGGVVAFRSLGTITIDAGGRIDVSALGYSGGSSSYGSAPGNGQNGKQGEGYPASAGTLSKNANGNGGGGGIGNEGGDGGGGGGNGTSGTNGATRYSTDQGGVGGGVSGNSSLTSMTFGGGGGSGGGEGNSNSSSVSGAGGKGGGIIVIFVRNLFVNGNIRANGGVGGNATKVEEGSGGGGGGAGGSILIKAQIVTSGINLISALGGSGGAKGNPTGGAGDGGIGGVGRIRIEYGALTGTTNPSASTQQVNYYSLSGTTPTTLYLPETIATGTYTRYLVKYGQRSLNTNGGDQLFSLTIPNRQYSSFTLSSLVERVAGSGSSFNFCLDIANNATCEWTVNGQSFSGPVQLDSSNLAAAVNAYVTAQHSGADTLTIPIRVNLSTPADIFLFNVNSSVGSDIDLQPNTPVLAPQNGNPASNTPEGVSVNVSATIKNNGTYKAENFTVGFYQGDPLNGGTLIGSTFIQSLAAGATSPTQTVVWNTAGLTPGIYDIYVKTDASGAIAEIDESNNTASATAVVKKKPDLVAVNLSAPDLRAGESGTASVVVLNDGQADVTGAVVKLYNGNPDTGILLGSTTVNVTEGQTVTAQVTFSIAAAGKYSLSAKVDPDAAVVEADESNNVVSTTGYVGWNLLTIDAGGTSDIAYTGISGYGYKSTSSPVTTCGTGIEKSYRQAASADALEYQFDNLLPGRRYHLDLTFTVCSGERWVDIFIDGTKAGDTSGAQPNLNAVHVTSTAQTVSILLDPSDYQDGSINLSLKRASGLNGPVVSIIDLQEIRYCYRDSGPNETPWTSINTCGYDPAGSTDGFNGWGIEPEETVRFSDGGTVNYKFTSLVPAKKYNTRLTFFEGDNAGRSQNILLDGTLAQSVTVSGTVQYAVVPLTTASYSDGQVTLGIQRVGGGDVVISEVVLEENTRAENNRYPAPPEPTPTVTPTPTSTTTVTPPVANVVLSSFAAQWSGNLVNLTWSTTTEINNAAFKLYRSTDALTWTEIATVASTRACGNYTGITPVNYAYSDTDVTQGNTYYYRLQFSGEGCGAVSAFAALMAKASAGPDNDPRNGAHIISLTDLVPFKETGHDVTGATSDSNDPLGGSCGLASGQSTVWYTFTPTASRSIELSTSGSNIDTILAVWTGLSDTPILVGCSNDVSSTDKTSILRFKAKGSVTYYIEVARDKKTTAPMNHLLDLSAEVVPTFMDVTNKSSVFFGFIERLVGNGITGGCTVSPPNYCPNNAVTRAQMAIFLLKAKHGSDYVPPAATGIFGDVPVSSFTASWIEQLYHEGITGGCSTSPLLYCPNNSVSRAQMAIFLLKAKYGHDYTPPPASGIFADVPVTSFTAPFIEQLSNEGITGGCSIDPLKYCPGKTVTRDQMAVFLVKTFNLP